MLTRDRRRGARWRSLGLGVGALAVAEGCGIGGPPSDDAMIQHFRLERAAFDGLVAMLGEDGIEGQLVIDALPAGSAARRARRERSRALAGRTGSAAIIRDRDGRVWFTYRYPTSGGGVAGTGFKDYLYAPTPPSPVRGALDDGGLRRFEDTFRHVDGEWYLYRMRI